MTRNYPEGSATFIGLSGVGNLVVTCMKINFLVHPVGNQLTLGHGIPLKNVLTVKNEVAKADLIFTAGSRGWTRQKILLKARHAGLPSDSIVSLVARIAGDLKEQLEFGLRARRPSEFAFIQRVVTMVKANQLPEKLVKSTFQWARHKKPYPFPYFERALRIRAAKLGIQI